MEVKIKTCTPIWTGGFEAGKCDRIHETGILGSLRWWMEVLVRGMGGDACDQTEQICLYDFKKSNNGVCKVCEVFGATGWKRQFRLEVQDIEISDAQIKHTITADRTYKNNKGEEKTPTWYFRYSKPKNGTFIIKIQSLNPNFKPEIIAGLIQFIANWSAVGARPQMGFGVIKIEDDYIPMQPLYEWLISTALNKPDQQLPSLQNIFIAKIQPKNSSFDEKSIFNLKYDIRNLFRTNESKPILKKDKKKDQVAEEKELRHFIMGAAPKDSDKDRISENKKAAKVKISRPYKDKDGNNVMRVWGWIPEGAEEYKNGWNREKVVNDIYKHLEANYTLHIWREMKSTRDTTTRNETDIQVFLHSLFKLQESVDAI